MVQSFDSDSATSAVRIFGNRFRVTRPLKCGNGIETFLALDLTTKDQVVVKATTHEHLSLGAQMRLEHEAAVLRQVRSPYIAPLLELSRQDDFLYLAMSFVSGVTLQERLRRGTMTVREALRVGQCLMSALQEAHEHGVLHRDIKPANIIVDESPDETTRASLIDFGLARSARLDASIRDQPVGTARYISPEQAGLLDLEPDERSDLYSFGVVLFECLAGRALFEGDSVGDVLRQHMTVRPPELRDLGLTVPRCLDEVIQRLLRKDPRDRYQTAEAVLADLEQIGAALEKGIAEPTVVVGLRDRRRSLTEPAFVGRDAELAALDFQVEQARQGDGGLVFLEAESGGGKTRLLQELAHRVARGGCLVFRGQGLDQAAQRPFQLLVGVAADLIHACRREPALCRAMNDRLGDQREAVCAAIPELGEVFGSQGAEALGPESFGQARSVQALSALLSALGSPDHPALVVLDDCQWADEETLALLSAWQKKNRQEEQPHHTLLVAAYRSEEVAADSRLRMIPATLQVKLTPFEARDVRRLAESMAGPLPGEALRVIENLSDGSPFMTVAALQGLVESGALVSAADGWRVEPLALADVQSSRHAAAFLVRRMEMLPDGVLDLLTAGAVLGKEFDLDFAAKLTEKTPARAVAAIDEARRRHIIWTRRGETRCAFIHDKLRQTLLERLRSEEREVLHARAAQLLEEQDPERVFDLAYHFDASGLPEKALPYALVAAAKARARHSLEVAEQQYRIAGRGVHYHDLETRFAVAEGLGDVLMLRGRYDEAAVEFEAALTLARGNGEKAQIEGKLGELAFKRGDVRRATARIEHALSLLGRRVPHWTATLYLWVLWEVVVQFFHSLCPRYFVGRKSLDGFGTEKLALHLYSRLAHLYWFHRGTVAALWAHLRELNRAERYPPTPELAQAYSEHAPGMSLLAWFDRGIRYTEKSLVMRREFNDLWGQGQSLHFHGIVLYAASRFKESILRCRDAVRLLERTGDFWEVNIARFQIAASLYRLGDFAGAIAEAQRMHRSGMELGDAQASGISLDVWARASLGRVPAETIQGEMARPTGDVQRNAQVFLAEGVRLYYAGKAEQAAETLTRAQRHLARAGVKNAWVSPVLPWLTSALRKQAEETSALTPGRRKALIRRALATAKQSLRLTRKFQNDYPHALREYGLLLAMRGRPWRARRYFDRSLAIAEAQGAIYEHAQTLLARGRIGREFGWPGAEEDCRDAQAALRGVENAFAPADDSAEFASKRQPTLSLADRFDVVLEAGRAIASALTREAIFSAVRDAALKLLRGERCLILRIDAERGQENLTLVSGEIEAEYSRLIARKALDAGRAVAMLEGAASESSESVLLAGVRSALCAPIFARGRPVGCLYVTHRQISGLFGKDEEQLADYISALAGAAMENAEGFGELQRLNQTLEHQFEESQRAEKRIQQQAALLDKARDAIAVHDMSGRVLYWNQSAERLYGWSAAEAMGKKVDDLLFRGTSQELADARRQILKRGEWHGELAQITKEGKEITVESRWTLVRDDDGRPRSKLVVNTDITEKKKLESQFLRAQRMESIGTLAGGIAHDINNLLLPIMMSVELLKWEMPEAERLAILRDLETSAQRGADMVKQILSFSRGVSGQKVMVQLKHVLVDMAKMVQRTFPKSIHFTSHLARDLWVVHGDPTQLYQLVMNLCVNARDAMPQGGSLDLVCENVTLGEEEAAGLHLEARAGCHVLLRVKDNGTGIPAAILDKIFDPFFTTKEFGKGTGLGLATVLGIVKGHGGFLIVDSVPQKGTEFSIYLPAAEAESTRNEEQSPEQLTVGHGETILVVDDEASICSVTRKNLEAHGYHVLTARSGLEAVDLFKRNSEIVQLVLTDMMMPGMDGTATIKALRKLDPKLRIVAASGMASLGESARAAGAEFEAFLAKPYKVEHLLKTVDTVLHG